MTSKSIHSFHIPVMGTAFTIDTPIKIARYGISSVMSIGDDELCENMREHYAKECNKPFTPIKKWDEDYRARRITAYLDLVQDIVDEQFLALKSSDFEPGSEITKYFELLHDQHPLNQAYCDMLVLEDGDAKRQAQDALRQRIEKGSLDVNIMTKIDRNNYSKQGELLPEEFSDALVALKKGQVTETPVKSQFGFHIIRLDDLRDTPQPKFEDVKPEIVQQLQQNKLVDFQKALRDKAKIE